MKDNILVSACLLGVRCRYDGESKPCAALDKLKYEYNLISVCPEVLGGLKTPRSPSEICGGKVVGKDGRDNTAAYILGAERVLEIAKENNCTMAVLKSKSPSCGKGRIYDGSFSGNLINGDGITARMLMENNITVLTEDEIE